MTKIAKNYYLFLLYRLCLVGMYWSSKPNIAQDGTTIQLGQLGNLSLQQQTVTNADSYDLPGFNIFRVYLQYDR